MALHPWTVGVLSTSYDLEEYRREIIDELNGKGVTVSAFEEAEFPSEPDMHSHDSCLVALERVDIAIVIINKRSGGAYYSARDKKEYRSITEQEYVRAIELGIPIFTFVKKEAWDERHIYRVNLLEFIKEKHHTKDVSEATYVAAKEEFDKSYVCTYVDNIATLDFIDRIQRAFDTEKASNWINVFTDVDDLRERVIGKLKGHSRKIVEKIAISQWNSLMKKHTSTAFGFTLGDVFNSDYYVEPPYEVESGVLLDGDTLSEQINGAISTNQSLLVYGEAGYGKTTILAKCFTEHINRLMSTPSYDIPLYLCLKNKGSNYHFDIEQFINEELASNGSPLPKHSPYPYLDLSQIRCRFFCDGFDEMAESLSLHELDRITKSSVFENPMLLTCRYQFANRYLNDISFSDKFDVRLRIDSWNIDFAKKYIEKYCDNRRLSDATKNSIFEAIDENHDLKQVMDSPLLITMFMWYMSNPRRPISSITVVELFEKWIQALALRECTKISLIQLDDAEIGRIWAFTAWEIYLHKLNKSGSNLKIDDLLRSLEDRFPAHKSRISQSWFSALFDCYDDYIVGTFHEQFMEYLVAKVLIDACKIKHNPYPEFLRIVMRPEINLYFREIWNKCNNQEKEQVYSAIYEQYINNLGDDSQNAVFTRVHAIYHITRLESPNRREYIERAFKMETHISVLLSLYFGAIKMGQFDKEEEFYNLLLNDEKYNESNRGYHLAYYSDTIVGDELPFMDNLSIEWNGTLKAFRKHFSSTDLGHFYLRRIELVTMRQFINARKRVFPLTKDFISFLHEKINNPPYDKEQDLGFNSKVKEEYMNLKNAYERIENNDIIQ